jgi:hypothetical protein
MRPGKFAYVTLFVLGLGVVALAASACSGSGASTGSGPSATGAAPGAANFTLKGSARR